MGEHSGQDDRLILTDINFMCYIQNYSGMGKWSRMGTMSPSPSLCERKRERARGNVLCVESVKVGCQCDLNMRQHLVGLSTDSGRNGRGRKMRRSRDSGRADVFASISVLRLILYRRFRHRCHVSASASPNPIKASSTVRLRPILQSLHRHLRPPRDLKRDHTTSTGEQPKAGCRFTGSVRASTRLHADRFQRARTNDVQRARSKEYAQDTTWLV